MNASKLYYIISHYIDQGNNDVEAMTSLYEDIKGGYRGSTRTGYGNIITYNKIKNLAEDKTKKEIDKFFEDFR